MKNPLAGWVARLPVRVHWKLLAAFLAIVAIQVALGAVALRTLTAVNGRGDALVQLQRKIAAYRQLQHDVTTQLYSATSALVLQDRRSLDSTLRQLSQFGYDMDRLQFVAQDEAELLGHIREHYDRFVGVVTRALGSVRDRHFRDARETLRQEAGPLADQLERAANQLVNKAEADMVAAVEASRREYRIARVIVIACVAGSILLAVVLGYAISGSLIHPVRQIAAHLSQIAAGDFSQRVEVANRDELGGLAASVNRMRDELGRLYRQVQQRTEELEAALEQQTAISDILRVISSSPTNVQPVLQAVAESAARLCDSKDARIQLVEGDKLVTSQAFVHDPALPLRARAFTVIPIDRRSVTGRAVVDSKPVQVADLASASPDEYPVGREMAIRAGYRAILAVPLLREGKALGTIVLRRAEVRPFTERQIALVQTFADQAAIAIENVRLFNETKESLEQQTAISEILRVISSSPTDVQPVLQAVAERAARLCDSTNSGIMLVAGDKLVMSQASVGRWTEGTALPIDRQSFNGRAVVEGKPVHVTDASSVSPDEYPVGRERAIRIGHRTILAVPLLREGKALGTISLRRMEVRPFTDRQIALVQTFADQAAIAIENVRLFNETKESLEQQTAISDILRVISSSPTDVQPVLQAVAERAARLCDSRDARIWLLEGDKLVVSPVGVGDLPTAPGMAQPIDRQTVNGRAVVDCKPVQVADLASASPNEYPLGRELAILRGHRTTLAVPLMREGKALGTISLRRGEVQPFTERQIALVQTFADQAAIAIENVRLFNETKEALEQQTAISEILRVISSSPTDVQPVLQAVAERAARLCDNSDARIWLIEGDRLKYFSGFGDLPSPEAGLTLPVSRQSVNGRAIIDGKPVHVQDLAAQAGSEYPDAAELRQRFGHRTQLSVPLMRESKALGAIALRRAEVRPFTERQIALVQTFADQAAIAIENVRLFNETKESLEQQTAISEILRVISSSPTDVQPVLQAVAERAMRLCEGKDAGIYLVEGDKLVWSQVSVGDLPTDPGHILPIDRQTVSGRAVVDGKPVQVADLASASPDEYPVGRELAIRFGHRTILTVPLMRESRALGAIALRRAEVRPFTARQIALVQTFADQAAIAIENVRLFNETKESLEQQTAISDILRVISGSPTDVTPVLQAVAERAARLCDSKDARIVLVEGDKLVFSQVGVGDVPTEPGLARPIDRQSVNGRAVVDCKPVQVADLASASPDEYLLGRELAIRGGFRTTLAVPLMREGKALGTISLRRVEVRPFTERQIALVQTFADQAAIAIENVRLFNETKESLEQQTATGEILRVISDSPTDVQPVLDAVAAAGARLCDSDDVQVLLIQNDALHLLASCGDMPKSALVEPIPVTRGSVVGRAVLDKIPVRITDALAEAEQFPDSYRYGQRLGNRAVLAVPLLREGQAVGAILLRRDEPRAFTEEQLALLQTFAHQAAIAIANVRLFREIQDKSRELEIANKHKSEFLANMSHELRTPLNAIIGFSEVLNERMFGELNEKQADYLNDIHNSGKHLLSLINDILDLAKIEAGRMELEVAAFSVPGALENALTLVRERAQRHGLSLSLAVDPAVDTIEGDERKFKQIVLNLLSNAVKFTPDGGRVAVRAQRAGERVAVSVEDTGIGIAPEDQEWVFEEFRQAGGLYSGKAEGTGLGLALAKRFVEMHGGSLRLKSSPGAGSTFTFELPVSR